MEHSKRITFKEILEQSRPQTRRSLWKSAIEANLVAKCASGRSRRIAYKAKTVKLQALIDQQQAQVGIDVSGDEPLLSIYLNDTQKLHAIPSAFKTSIATQGNFS
jgi:hypothetical protein